MRRKHCEITDPQEIDRILRTATIGRLATNGADGFPYITPVNYVWHDGNIYFHCSPKGEKLDNLARDPKVCFEVDVPLAYIDTGRDPERNGCNVHQFYHCVIIRGNARVVSDSPLKVAALNALIAAHEKEGNYQAVTEDMHAYRACHVVEVQPTSVSAKSDLGQNRTAEDRLALARYLKARNRLADPATVEAMGFRLEDLS
jgi:nitroimidazol reductase NimA-like FMN-containing flavoprotein (pyridoxamine 5'-phosphate oxidase superfamily)